MSEDSSIVPAENTELTLATAADFLKLQRDDTQDD